MSDTFERHTTTTLTRKHGRNFSILIENEDGLPRWTVRLIDYDDNTGAIGIFSSEAEAIDRMDGFILLAMPAYEKKHAKHGRMPLITVKDGKLEIDISPDDDACSRMRP